LVLSSWWVLSAVILGGAVGTVFRLPAGAMVGGLIGGLLVKGILGLGLDAKVPGLSAAAQVGIAYVLVRGTDFASVRNLPKLLPAAFAYGVLLLAITIGLAWIFSHFWGMDFMTALFATSPGGLSGMAVAAEEAGADAPISVLFNLCRIVVILIGIPLLAAWWGRG
jgi:membrane AbrB-like protein